MSADTRSLDYFRGGGVFPYPATTVDNFTFDYSRTGDTLNAMVKNTAPGPTLSVKFMVDDFTTWKQGVKIYTP